MTCWIVLAAALGGAQPADLSKLDVVERAVPAGPVALVDGKEIPREEFLYQYGAQREALAMQIGKDKVDDSVRAQVAIGVLRELAQREILHQEALRRGIKVTEKDIDDAIERRMKAIKEQTGQEAKDILSEGFLDRVKGPELRAKMRRALLIRKMRETLSGAKGVAEADLKKFYDAEKDRYFKRPSGVHLHHILVRAASPGQPPTEREWKKAEEKIERAQKRIQAGESFEAVARSMSDAADAARGGDIGVESLDNLPATYVKAIENLAPGATTGIIKGESGYAILRLESRENARQVSFEEARPQIEAALRASSADEAVDRFCEPAVRDTSRIHVYLKLDSSLMPKPPAGANTKQAAQKPS
jgi:parvulin-like peptidyl-prolyl isomerase